MYPFLRLGAEMRRAGRLAPLSLGEDHVTPLRILPTDIDPWRELNNGRTLTLFDIGRFGMFARLGIVAVMRERRWAGAVAGASVRWRRRVRAFERVEMRSRMIGWDVRFSYSEQAIWRDGECCAHALLRLAVSGKDGLVPAERLARDLGYDASPPLPSWVEAWADADAQRPWPPA